MTPGMPLSMMNDPEAMQRYLQYMQMVHGMPEQQNFFDQMPMMLAAGSGASPQTERALRMDPDLGGVGGYPAQAGGTNPLQPLGRDPTRRVTQEEYDRQVREDNERAMANYLKHKALQHQRRR